MNESVSSINCGMYHYQPDPLPMWTLEVVHWIVHGSTRFVNLRQRNPKKVGNATLGGWRLNSMFVRLKHRGWMSLWLCTWEGGSYTAPSSFSGFLWDSFAQCAREKKRVETPNKVSERRSCGHRRLRQVGCRSRPPLAADIFRCVFKNVWIIPETSTVSLFEWNFARVTSSRCFRRFLPETYIKNLYTNLAKIMLTRWVQKLPDFFI